MNDFFKRAQRFITHDIWHTSLEGMSRGQAAFIYNLRVLTLSVRGYMEDQIVLRASALTYFTMLSIVPVLAMAFAIAKGFGVRQILEDQLKSSLEGQQEIIDKLIPIADKMLTNTQGGLMAGIGIVILLWSVVKVLWNIEISFNYIWQIKRERSFTRKLSDYLSIIIIGPLLVILSGSVNIYISTELSQLSKEIGLLEKIGPYILFLFKFSPYLMIWLLFTLLYMVMPNANVRFKSALVAGIIAGTIFQLVQWGYIYFQIGVSRFNAIYGTFAAIPLFLIFLQTAWMIVLWGAEFSFAHQHVNQYEYEADTKNLSAYDRRLACLTVMYAAVKAFEKGKDPVTVTDIAEDYKAPVKLISEVINDLLDARLIIETTDGKDTAFVPSTDIHKIDIHYVLNALGTTGNGTIHIEKERPMSCFREKLEAMLSERKASKENILLMEL